MANVMHREEVICEEPLLTVDRQMGLNIVHPEGKVCAHFISLTISSHVFRQPAKTIFKRIRYDANTDTSVLQCKSS